MTAPDPRLGEIEARANNPFSPDNTRAQMDEDRDYILAELRKAQDALARVEDVRQELFGLSNDEGWTAQTRAVYRDASRAINTALHAAVAAATGGGERG